MEDDLNFVDSKNQFNVQRMALLEFRNHFGVNQQPSGAAIDRGSLGGMIAPPPL